MLLACLASKANSEFTAFLQKRPKYLQLLVIPQKPDKLEQVLPKDKHTVAVHVMTDYLGHIAKSSNAALVLLAYDKTSGYHNLLEASSVHDAIVITSLANFIWRL